MNEDLKISLKLSSSPNYKLYVEFIIVLFIIINQSFMSNSRNTVEWMSSLKQHKVHLFWIFFCLSSQEVKDKISSYHRTVRSSCHIVLNIICSKFLSKSRSLIDFSQSFQKIKLIFHMIFISLFFCISLAYLFW